MAVGCALCTVRHRVTAVTVRVRDERVVRPRPNTVDPHWAMAWRKGTATAHWAAAREISLGITVTKSRRDCDDKKSEAVFIEV